MYLVVEGKVTEFETSSSIFVASRLKKPRGGAEPPPPRVKQECLYVLKQIKKTQFTDITYFIKDVL